MTCDGATATAETGYLADTAERLRRVRAARERFLALHAVDHLLSATADRLATDPVATSDNPASESAVMRALFRGGRLDD